MIDKKWRENNVYENRYTNKITFCILLGISLATIGYFISSKIIVEKIFTKEMLNTSQNITKYLAEDIMNHF